MDIHSNLEYLCRVCAANTKGKNSVAECVYILKTAGLKDKLDKYLYLKISENDSLPKVLCKSCFRQVEATASLSKIAKHTQQVFRDFLLSNLPKGPSESMDTSEFTSSDLMGNKSKKDEISVHKAPVSSLVELPPPPAPTPLSLLTLLAPLTTASRKDEVVVNVSVADPLTRDNQQKMISNSQRRQSLLLDSRFTPKSIAQKQALASAAAPRLIAPKSSQSIDTINISNSPQSSAASLNFYPAKTQLQTKQQLQQTPQTTQITTFSSGGYVIGRVNTTSNDNEEPKKLTLPLKPDIILQQKRKNLAKALHNIKSNSSGQESLLKSSQQKQAEAMQNVTKTPLTEVVNQATEDELPERIIIAAPKNKSLIEKSKKEPLNLSSKVTPLSTAATITAAIQQQQEQADTLVSTPPKPAFPEDILLGRVIRDMDLLKLILKALKWPVDKQNMELQLQRLKNSKFTDIMSNPNLLQDRDLTQLLGPYLAPVLLAAQALQQQQQHILNNAALNNQPTTVLTNPKTVATQPKMTALEAAQAEINKSIPYKLPPETSVQLVPATPEETEPTPSSTLPTITTTTLSTAGSSKRDRQKDTKTTAVPSKKQRRAAAQKARDSIVISDEEDNITTETEAPKKSRQRSTKHASNIQFELNPNFMSQFSLLNGCSSNEAEEIMALLLKQKTAMANDKKVQRRRRNSISNIITLPPSEFDALIDLDDDIVLMEPVSTTSSAETNFSVQEQQEQQQKTDDSNTFVIPSAPLITRPIIKRRKTVIHAPKNRFDLSIELKSKDQTPISSCSLLKAKEKRLDETINQVATGNISNAENSNEQNFTKSINTEPATVTAVEPPVIKAPQQKKTQNKSTLGQQLLEAIGLQTLPSTMISNRPNEAASSSTLPNTTAVLPSSKHSVQQIRSALKKSLKQAQEQQQQKKKELSSSTTNTIIQDADSTTKSAIKEIVFLEGKGSKTDNYTSMAVDVEDQIAKVTLMLCKNGDNSEQSTAKTNVTTSEQDEKKNEKELKKSTGIKIQERRRTLLSDGARGVGVRNVAVSEKSNEVEQKEKSVENNEANENQKLKKEDIVNISSSSAVVSNTSNESTVVKNDQIVIPKRRGRKRLIDKLNELKAAEASAKEKDNEEISRTYDKSREEESDTASNNRNEEETEINKNSGRPARQSKTQSKYYKGPDKPRLGRRSLPSRTTRNRKYC